jgi:hypothetical protein
MWGALSDERTGLSFARLSQQYEVFCQYVKFAFYKFYKLQTALFRDSYPATALNARVCNKFISVLYLKKRLHWTDTCRNKIRTTFSVEFQNCKFQRYIFQQFRKGNMQLEGEKKASTSTVCLRIIHFMQRKNCCLLKIR